MYKPYNHRVNKTIFVSPRFALVPKKYPIGYVSGFANSAVLACSLKKTSTTSLLTLARKVGLMISTNKTNVMSQDVPALPAIYSTLTKVLEIVNWFTLPTIYVLKLNTRYLALYLKIKKHLAKMIAF